MSKPQVSHALVTNASQPFEEFLTLEAPLAAVVRPIIGTDERARPDYGRHGGARDDSAPVIASQVLQPLAGRSAAWRPLLTIFLLALLLYVPGIWWGLPVGVRGQSGPWGTDELGPVGAINEVYGVFASNEPTFNPQYPLFHYLTQLVLVAPAYVVFWLTGHLSYPEPNFPHGFDHPRAELEILTLLARFVSTLLAAGVVVMAFKTGEVLRNRATGMIAAALVLFQYTMVYYARTSNVDMGALFWTSVGLFVFARCLRDGATPGRWMALGVAAALATASKDASYAAFLPAGAVILALQVRQARTPEKGLLNSLRAPVMAVAVAAVVYVVAAGWIFRPSRAVLHFGFITHGTQGVFFNRYPATVDGYLAFLREFATQFVDAMGIPMLVASIAGIVWWARNDRRRLLWLLPAIGVIVGVILPVRFALLRFVMIPTYVMAFAAADLLAHGWSHQSSAFRMAGRAATVVVILFAAVRGGDLTYQMMFDGRQTASAWLGTVTRPGDRIGHVLDRAVTLPRLPDSVTRQELPPDLLTTITAADGPEFIVSMPLEDYEREHELDFPAGAFQSLRNGERGYRVGAVFQTPSLFARRPATFVNPPVTIFVREDVMRTRQLAQIRPPGREP